MLKIVMIMGLLSCLRPAFASDINVIAYDGRRAMNGKISSIDYAKTLVETKKAFDEQAVAGLQNFVDRGPSWRLSKFSLGLGLRGEIGIGPWKWGAALKQRFFYVR